MGLTPLSGLPGATRSGTVDPSLIFHYAAPGEDVEVMSHKRALTEAQGSARVTVTRAEEVLNRECGWKAVAGTADFAEVVKGRARSSSSSSMNDRESTKKAERCKLAFDMLVDRLVEYIGGYYVKLHGEVDALVFAGGIGEKSAELRAAVCAFASVIGFGPVDTKRNESVSTEVDGVIDIGREDGKRVLVCKTDEQVRCFWFGCLAGHTS